MIIAIGALIYACYLHIYYHGRTISLRESEELKYRENMKILEIDEDEINQSLRKFLHIEDLIKANKKLKKAVNKHKLDS